MIDSSQYAAFKPKRRGIYTRPRVTRWLPRLNRALSLAAIQALWNSVEAGG